MSAAGSVSFHPEARQRGVYGIMPIGARQVRSPTVAEVVHFHTCHASGPYCAVNLGVPAWVPVWQYVAPADRLAAMKKGAAS